MTLRSYTNRILALIVVLVALLAGTLSIRVEAGTYTYVNDGVETTVDTVGNVQEINESGSAGSGGAETTASGYSLTLPITQTWDLGGVDPKYLDNAKLTVHYSVTSLTGSSSYNDGTEDITVNEQSILQSGFDIAVGTRTETTGDDGTVTETYVASQDLVLHAQNPGLYAFRLTTSMTSGSGYTYDTHSYIIRLYVKNETNGTTSVFVTAERVDGDATTGTKVTTVGFTHTFEGVTVNDPPVRKVINGDTPSANGRFRFEMRPVHEEDRANETYPMPAHPIVTISTRTSDTGEIGDITFTNVGTYEYEVMEINDGLDGYSYDTRIYYVTYKVTVDPTTGLLTSTRTIEMVRGTVRSVVTDDDETEFQFSNGYKASGGGSSGESGSDGSTIRSLINTINEIGDQISDTVGEITEPGSTGDQIGELNEYGGNDHGNAYTGDDSNMMLYLVIILLAGASLAAWAVYRNRTHRHEQ